MATDLERKTKAIGGIAENFGKEFSADLLKIWLRLLRPYPPELVEAAAVRVIETYAYKTMPPYAVLREAIEEVAGAGPQAIGLKAAAEWTRLQEDVSRYGSYAPPEDMHPTTAHVVGMMGGWRAVCMWETRYLDLKRREFVDLWTQADGKADVLALGAAGVQRAIAQTRGGFVRVGVALPGGLMALGESRKQIGA